MQALDYNYSGRTFNILTCDWECWPQTCHDDTYYWDAEECKCLCYPQECPVGFDWNNVTCCCDCNGIPEREVIDGNGNSTFENTCPCGTVWDADCCECTPCQDRGECDKLTQYFNPNTCECTCLPVCCEDNETFNTVTCLCSSVESVCQPWLDAFEDQSAADANC